MEPTRLAGPSMASWARQDANSRWGIGGFGHVALKYTRAAAEVLAETVWPRRCAVCGTMGFVLCPTCAAHMPFIDQWLACPRCGAPFGLYQCTECNSFSLAGLGRTTLPFDQCVSAVVFAQETARVVRLRKDQGERQLAHPMGLAVARVVPPGWLVDGPCVTFVPSTPAALRRRGFCHAKELAESVADLLDVECASLLQVASVRDQRALGRKQRARNTNGNLSACVHRPIPAVIVVDDVYTTGSTSMAAAQALKDAGIGAVFVATFARV